MEAPAHILVVDDDTRLRDLLNRYLTDQGLRVTTAAHADEARAKLASIDFDLIVLDVMMPGEDGFELTRSLRQTRAVPILLLTALDEVDSRIEGFESGADDFLSKPFEPRELVLRIQAVLRRAEPSAMSSGSPAVVAFGDFMFDPLRGELRRNAEFVRLTSGEVSLLRALARKPGVPVSREELAAEGSDVGNQRTVDVQVTRLRRKIEQDPRYPRYLQTVRGTGYVLVTD